MTQSDTDVNVVIEYRVNKSANSDVVKNFLTEFKNNIETEFRKCIKCGTIVKDPNKGTAGMRKHLIACSKNIKRPADGNQQLLFFPKASRLSLPKGLDVATKLIYEDQIPIMTVAKSAAMQSMFASLNFAKISYCSINNALNEKYITLVENIKSIIEKRNKDQILTISFDKWSSQDNKNFIGVFLYIEEPAICKLCYLHFKFEFRSSVITISVTL